MALKDWKKVGKYKWKRKDKTKYPLFVNIEKVGTWWYVYVSVNNRIIEETKFTSSKVDALKYAKAYMRKH